MFQLVLMYFTITNYYYYYSNVLYITLTTSDVPHPSIDLHNLLPVLLLCYATLNPQRGQKGTRNAEC